MSPDTMLITLSSLGFASVFLALIIGMTDRDASSIVSSVSNLTPSARRAAKMEELNNLTRIADEAIEARRLGRRFTRADAGL
jgi:hypothetical protein